MCFGRKGNAPIGHTLTDKYHHSRILIITGREGNIHTHTTAHTDTHTYHTRIMTQEDFTTVSLFSNSTLALTMNSFTNIDHKTIRREDSPCHLLKQQKYDYLHGTFSVIYLFLLCIYHKWNIYTVAFLYAYSCC